MQPNYQVLAQLASQKLILANRKRTSLTIFMPAGAAVVYFGFQPGISDVTGILLTPETYMTFSRGLGDEPELAVYFISTVANTRIHVMEQYGKVRVYVEE